MASIDDDINETWTKLRNSFNQLPEIGIDLPNLEKLIDEQPNNQILKAELKEAVMKWYWNGYYQGFDDKTRK